MYPVCVECNTIMRVEKNGVIFIELLDNGYDPYRIYNTDKYTCSSCSRSILSKFGNPKYLGFGNFRRFIKDIRDSAKEIIIESKDGHNFKLVEESDDIYSLSDFISSLGKESLLDVNEDIKFYYSTPYLRTQEYFTISDIKEENLFTKYFTHLILLKI